MSRRVDPEFNALLSEQLLAARSKVLPHGEVLERRKQINEYQGYLATTLSTPDDVKYTKYETPTEDGHSLQMRWYTKAGAETTPDSPRRPAVLYIHGGALVASCVEHYHPIIANYVSLTCVPFLAVEYRLAPEHPYPTPLGDCYSALVWLARNHDALQIDSHHIIVMGDSAGGGLAASLCYKALQEQEHKDPFHAWRSVDNLTCWEAYLGSGFGKKDMSSLAAAGRLKDATGMPELYVDVGDLDLLASEAVAYAQRHLAAGIATELHVYKGAPHGFDMILSSSAVAESAMAGRVRAIKQVCDR
ncbi:alpha/beta hydrolase [Aspergillus undulatus]|uniref:alpha/beta hydrolase n=1 Tax=Aspergillus undulatus TaxID=1810928 RepID=UPI003CCDB3A9